MKPKWLACASFVSVVVWAVFGCDDRTVAANQQPTALTLQPAFVSLPAFSEPVAMLQAPGDSARWFVVEKPGVVRVFANDPGVSTSSVFADITRKVHTAGELEAGLLGMAFDPKFGSAPDQNRFVYLFYTAAPSSGYRLRSTIARFTANAALIAVDPSSEVRLIGLDKLESNHNGGHLVFGPDGLLYAGFGEGGGEPNPQAQDDKLLFGKIIRINPSAASGRLPYTIPADNPNAGNSACNSGRGRAPCPEVWARGLRNPWRFSFDRADGRLWVGDVGWGKFEEINIVTKGANYGWPIAEGAACVATGCNKAGLTDPVHALARSDAQSITGGFVYRGTQATEFVGQYIFADFESRMFGAVAGGRSPGTYSARTLIPPFTPSSIQVSSFAEANDGELFALDFSAGRIRKLVFAAR